MMDELTPIHKIQTSAYHAETDSKTHENITFFARTPTEVSATSVLTVTLSGEMGNMSSSHLYQCDLLQPSGWEWREKSPRSCAKHLQECSGWAQAKQFPTGNHQPLTPSQTTEQFICHEVKIFKWHGGMCNINGKEKAPIPEGTFKECKVTHAKLKWTPDTQKNLKWLLPYRFKALRQNLDIIQPSASTLCMYRCVDLLWLSLNSPLCFWFLSFNTTSVLCTNSLA